MVINLTKEEYQRLVKLAYLGEWTANAFRDPARTLAPYEDALRTLLAHAQEGGIAELADPETGNPTEELEMDRDIRRLIDEYNDESFWYELLERFAYRDLEKQLGFRAVRDMNPEEREDRLESLKEKYLEEFEKNGIENLRFQR